MRSAQTAERPRFLGTDSLARYSYVAKFCEGKTVLDVGSGLGFGAEFVAKSGARRVVGIDYNQAAIKSAKRAINHKNLKFKRLNVFDLDKIDEKFDVVLAFEIIEHLPVDRVGEFLSQICDRLAQGGRLFLSTPNALKSKFLWGRPYNPYHIKEYRQSELRDLLGTYFSQVDIKGYRLISKNYLKRQSEISQSLFSKVSFYLGHFRLVREILAFIPTKLKNFVTKEHTLPVLTHKDYEFKSASNDCEGLLAIAKKDTKRVSAYPKVSVVIANYNGEEYLGSCLDCVFASDYENFEVIVCDDGSSDKSVKILKNYEKKKSEFRLLRNKSNIGASATRNKAVSKTKGEILVFLDNDTMVRKDWLSRIIEPFVKDPSIGGAQALLLDMSRKQLVQHAGALMIPHVAWAVPFYQWQKYSKIKKEIRQRKIIAVSASLAVRKHVFKLIGGFDEKEAVHTEDTDFAWRVWIAGYKIVLAKDAITYHLAKSVASRKHMGSSNYKIYFHLAKNSFRSIIKNYELENVLRFLPQSIVINIARGVLVLIKRGDPSALLATFRAIFWNMNNLSDNLKQRRLVRSKRLVSDSYIMDRVFDQRSLKEIYESYFKQTKLI